MIINNRLKERSFEYQEKLGTMECRKTEVLALLELSQWCMNLKEQIRYDANILYDLEVAPEVSFLDFLYNGQETDMTRLLMEMIHKNCREDNLQGQNGNQILCALGSDAEAAGSLMDYVGKRRNILNEIDEPLEYAGFMRSCFPNCLFAVGCESEFLHIKDFSIHRSEITKCLSVLNDEAIRLYEENHDNLTNRGKNSPTS